MHIYLLEQSAKNKSSHNLDNFFYFGLSEISLKSWGTVEILNVPVQYIFNPPSPAPPPLQPPSPAPLSNTTGT